jgi:hypothetical protein
VKGVRIVDISKGVAELADRRCKSIVRRTATIAQYGTVDLSSLARSCYLQGVTDGVQLASSRPEVVEKFKNNHPEITCP